MDCFSFDLSWTAEEETIIIIFHTSISKYYFTGVWVIASLFRFPGLFSVF